jgi:hypothetical protein
MQLRSRTITSGDVTSKLPTTNAAPKAPTRNAPKTRQSTRKSPKNDDRACDDAALDIGQMSENGIRHAIRYAEGYEKSHNTSLHAHFIADGKRLYRRVNETDVTTRSGGNSRRIRQNEFDAFVRFVQNEAGVDITDDVKNDLR